MRQLISEKIIKDSNIISTDDIDNETIIFKDGKLTAQAEVFMAPSTTETLGAGRIATPIEVLNKQANVNTEVPAFVSVDDLKVLFGADFDEAGYKCIVSSDSTEIGEHIIKDANLPTLIAHNSKYIINNPFGNNTPILLSVEIFANNNWGCPSFALSNSLGYGVTVAYKQGIGIYIITGSGAVSGAPINNIGGSFDVPLNNTTYKQANCRIHVFKSGSKTQ